VTRSATSLEARRFAKGRLLGSRCGSRETREGESTARSHLISSHLISTFSQQVVRVTNTQAYYHIQRRRLEKENINTPKEVFPSLAAASSPSALFRFLLLSSFPLLYISARYNTTEYTVHHGLVSALLWSERCAYIPRSSDGARQGKQGRLGIELQCFNTY
jgi:hypothetical protein